MSLEKDINTLVQNKINDFIRAIHIKYNIDTKELKSLWNGESTLLEKKSKQDLVDMCKKAGVDCKGKKKDLIERLSQSNTKLQNDYKVIISKNKHGYYEHSDTKLIFNKADKVVIGKQLDSGEIAELTLTDIDTCNKYNFEYALPENLQDDDDDASIASAKEDDVSDNEFSDFLEEDD